VLIRSKMIQLLIQRRLHDGGAGSRNRSQERFSLSLLPATMNVGPESLCARALSPLALPQEYWEGSKVAWDRVPFSKDAAAVSEEESAGARAPAWVDLRKEIEAPRSRDLGAPEDDLAFRERVGMHPDEYARCAPPPWRRTAARVPHGRW